MWIERREGAGLAGRISPIAARPPAAASARRCVGADRGDPLDEHVVDVAERQLRRGNPERRAYAASFSTWTSLMSRNVSSGASSSVRRIMNGEVARNTGSPSTSSQIELRFESMNFCNATRSGQEIHRATL